MQLFKNNAKSRLKNAIGAADLSLDVTTDTGDLFPVIADTSQFFLATLENSAGDKEIIKVTARSNDNFTISERGLDGTTAMGFVAGDLVELRLTAGFIESIAKGSLTFVIDGGGSAITTGVKGFIEAPFAGSITGCKVFGDEASAISILIFKTTWDNYPFTYPDDVAEEISDSANNNNPKIASGYKGLVSDLSGWTKPFERGDIFVFYVDTVSNITKCTISLSVSRNIEA